MSVEEGNIEVFLTEAKKYIKYCTDKYKNIFEDFEDLEQEAMRVAIQYGKNYNYNMNLVGQKLLLRMYWEITKYLLRNLNRILDFTERYCLCMKVYEACKNNIGKEPNYLDISNHVGITRAEAYEVLYVAKNYEDYKPNLLLNEEEIEDKEYDLEEICATVINTKIFEEKFLPKLTEKQRRAIIMRYGFCGEIPRSAAEIARQLGTTRQNVVLLTQYAQEGLSESKKLRKFYKD